MATVLDGVRVLEVADWGFVPSAGAALGDWGAEVIKVEHPRVGDPIRGLITGGLIPGASGRNFIVEQIGRHKRSVGGIEIDVSLLGTAMWVMSPDITAALMYGSMLPTAGEMPVIPNPLVGNYRCGDGKSLVLMMLQSERFWPHFAETVGRRDLLERFPTPEARQTHRQEMREELERHFA